MSTNLQTLLVILICLIIVVIIVGVAILLSRKKIDATDVIEKVDTAIDYAGAIASALKPFLPGIAGTAIEAVLNYADKAITHVEAVYKAQGAAGPDTRAAEAESLIKSGLALQGIPETPEIDKLISTIIPVLVLALPKTHDAKAATPAA